MATRVAQQVASAFGGLAVVCGVFCVFCLLRLIATCIVTPSSLDKGDLCTTCTHSASTRAKKDQGKTVLRLVYEGPDMLGPWPGAQYGDIHTRRHVPSAVYSTLGWSAGREQCGHAHLPKRP